jgi:L-2,4-diaminobutyric acid acetyltransferase
LSLPANACCRWVTATVADDNLASSALFHRLAREHDTRCQVTPYFTVDLFPADHPAEPLLRVGPIARHTPARGVQSQLENPIPV